MRCRRAVGGAQRAEQKTLEATKMSWQCFANLPHPGIIAEGKQTACLHTLNSTVVV